MKRAFLLLAILSEYNSGRAETRIPFYIIAHMVNSIEHVDYFLSLGSNALEADVRFDSKTGEALNFYHGGTCNCCTECQHRESMTEYFQYIRNLTLRSSSLFNENFSMLMIDLKLWDLDDSGQAGLAGEKFAQIMMNNLMFSDGGELNDFLVVLSIPDLKHIGFITRLDDTIKKRDQRLLKFIYYDIWQSHVDSIKALIEHLWKPNKMYGRIFQGHGSPECLKQIANYSLLDQLLEARKHGYDKFGYVYFWTRNSETSLTQLLNKGVNGIITDRPEYLQYLITEDPFRKQFYLVNRNIKSTL